MEGRLASPSAPPVAEIATQTDVPPPRDSEESLVAADAAARSLNGTESESINVWPDEAAEASFFAEARERGETVRAVPAAAVEKEDDERNPKSLPPLEDLVGRLSPELRETLDDLFRAKFTSVRRLPAKVFKS